MTEREPNHITFRPGEELRERLARGLMSTGAKAKRDLLRYYQTLDLEFRRWWDRRMIDEDQWFFIAKFVQSRAWKEPPASRDFIHEFERFMDGVQHLGYPRGTKALALSKVADLSYTEMLAIIDRAEDELMSQADARADAISAAS